MGRTGLPWRDLPPHLGSGTGCLCASVAGAPAACGRRCWSRCRRWAEPCPARASGRCHSTRPPCGPTNTRPGPAKKGPQALGRGRGGFSTKLHVAGDGAGGRLAFALTAGQAGDAPQAADLLAPLLAPARQVPADTADDSDALRAQIAETGAVAVIPPRPNRLQPPPLDPLSYRDRNQVERLINRLKQCRRIATRCDKLADSYAAFVQLRAITLGLN